MTRKMKPRVLVFLALCVALNLVGGNLALLLRLPVYLDTLGTILAAACLGPWAGMLVGLTGSLVTGLTTDLFSLYYLPVQLIVGLTAGLVYRYRPQAQAKNVWWRALAISLPGTLVSTLITVLLFNGITSSGSSLLVQLLAGLGLGKTAAVFIVQVGTDYLDRVIGVAFVAAVYRVVTTRLAVHN
ncbi:ECF transporter S component [Loigolactobacillus coryniformis]|uniref:ECF transporter S component n=1 Tax=Loigolactobacillus coryniformis subsp. torquens DSM 20004 = KCTC 3535 TaxID=1423822 RepID=A0A2D1KKG3_9LACO|nr:ECF transporter S component [Loigolactobacillus coryniformis]ATO42615.1 ECF transporter S component [Loigolactobacillus coryniformis subsp. torquens DSM 20004 = KCTC 3535]